MTTETHAPTPSPELPLSAASSPSRLIEPGEYYSVTTTVSGDSEVLPLRLVVPGNMGVFAVVALYAGKDELSFLPPPAPRADDAEPFVYRIESPFRVRPGRHLRVDIRNRGSSPARFLAVWICAPQRLGDDSGAGVAPDWRVVGVVRELHYGGAVRARVTWTERGWLLAFPNGVTTTRATEAEAKACAENDCACDEALPSVGKT